MLLYQLLTGHTPFDAKTLIASGLDEIRRTIRNVEPPKPSTRLSGLLEADRTTVAKHRQIESGKLTSLLRGDLDWIVMKALEKDRTRRYETANGFVRDIKCFLANEPVSAAAPSAAYRFSKFARRNKTAFGVTAGFAFILIVATCASTWQAIRATRAEGLAREQATRAARAEGLAKQRVVQVAAERDAKDKAWEAAKAEQEKVRRALAKAQLALAEAAYGEQDGMGMKAALEATPPDLRGPSWTYLFRQADTSLASVHLNGVGAAAVPARAGVFAVADLHRGISLVQAATGAILSSFKTTPRQLPHWARGVAVSPDSERVAVGTLGGGGIAIYDIRDGKPLVEWDAPDTDTLEFSPDGTRILQASGISGQTCLWDAKTGEELWRLDACDRAAFAPGGETVIAHRRGELVVLNASDAKVLRTLAGTRHGGVSALAIRSDGRLLVTGNPEGYLRAIDLTDGHTVFETSAHHGYIRCVDFTADGSRFVSVAEAEAGRPSIHVWDSHGGIRLHSLLGGSSRAEGVRIHPISQELIVSGVVTKTWALSRAKPAWVLPAGSTAAFFGSNERCISSDMQFGVATVVHLSKPEPSIVWRSKAGGFGTVAASADGQCAAAAERFLNGCRVQLIRNQGGAPVETQLLHTIYALSFMRLSPAGDHILTFVDEGVKNHQFNAMSGAVLPELDTVGLKQINDAAWLGGGHVAGITSAVKPRGTPGSDERLVLWDTTTGHQLTIRNGTCLMNCLGAAPDGKTFAEAGMDKMIRIRNAATLAVEKEFRAHDGSITALAWHPVLPILASAAADLTIKLWNLSTGECLAELRDLTKTPSLLQFSPNGQRLLSAGKDQVRIWELEVLRSDAAREVLTLPAAAPTNK